MLSLASAAVVAAIALAAPLVLGLTGIRLPEVVLEILLGIAIGPQVLNWAQVDEPVRVLSLVGLAFLLLLSGLEIDTHRLRGRVLRRTSAAFAVSFGIALLVGLLLGAAGLVDSPVLIAVILSATSLGIVLPVLTDAGQSDTAFGQVVVAGASIAEVVPIVLLSVLFSQDTSSPFARIVLLVTFLVFVATFGVTVIRLERSQRLSAALVGLQDTTSEIRVRGAMALLLLFAALASRFGLETILGAFLAGATLRRVDRDERMTHRLFPTKLRAVGFGAFIPFFFVSTGMTLDVRSLFDSPAALGRVPFFLVALLAVRALPTLLYQPLAERSAQLVAAGLLQATSLSIPVVAGAIGVELELIRPENYAALVAAGLLSVIAFPALALPRLQPEAPNRPNDEKP